MTSFPDRLKELRNAKKLKQTDMASFLELNIRTYQDYEYGNVIPNAVMITKLADYFDVTTDYLLGRTNHWIDKEGTLHTKVPVDILNLDTAELLKKLSTSE